MKILPSVWSEQKKFVKISFDEAKQDFNGKYRRDSGLFRGFKVLDISKKDIYGRFPVVIDIRFYGQMQQLIAVYGFTLKKYTPAEAGALADGVMIEQAQHLRKL